jgi:hypothetical protein
MIVSILLGILPQIITQFVGTLLAMVSTSLTIFSTSLSSIAPLLTGVSSFLVWYIKELGQGFKVIIQNASTMVVIMTMVGVAAFAVHHYDHLALVKALDSAKAADAAKIKALRRAAPKPTTDSTPTQSVCVPIFSDIFGC